MHLERIQDPGDPQLDDYRNLTDVALRRVLEPAGGLYMAESAKVLARAIDAGHAPRSVLTAEKWLDEVERIVGRLDVPVFVVPDEVAESVTGYTVHRGMLAAMHRPALPEVSTVLRGARTALVLDGLVDHTNVGGSKPPQVGDVSSDTSRPWQPKVAKSEFDDTFELNPGVSSGEERRRTAVPGASPAGRGDSSASKYEEPLADCDLREHRRSYESWSRV